MPARTALALMCALLLAPAASAGAATPQTGSYAMVGERLFVTFDVVRRDGALRVFDVRAHQHSRPCADGSLVGLSLSLRSAAVRDGRPVVSPTNKTQLKGRFTSATAFRGTIALRSELRKQRGACTPGPETFPARRPDGPRATTGPSAGVLAAQPAPDEPGGALPAQPLTLDVVDGGRYVRHDPIALRFYVTCPDGTGFEARTETDSMTSAVFGRFPLLADRTARLTSGGPRDGLTWRIALGTDGSATGSVRYRFTQDDGTVCETGELPWATV